MTADLNNFINDTLYKIILKLKVVR
jgi:hypothetical protein